MTRNTSNDSFYCQKVKTIVQFGIDNVKIKVNNRHFWMKIQKSLLLWHMGHDKLRKFAENETFACLLQPSAATPPKPAGRK